MSIFTELMFLQGYVTRPTLLREEEQLPPPAAAPRASLRPVSRPRPVTAVAAGCAAGGCG